MENIFQVVVVGRFLSFTPSLLHFLLDVWKPGVGGEFSIWKGMEWLWDNLNLIPLRDLWGRCLSFIIPLKVATWNGIGSITSYCSREDPMGTSRLYSHNREISRNQAWKQKLSVSSNYYYFKCTLNNTLTAEMVMFHRQHPKWDRNPWFVLETTSILSTLHIWELPPPPKPGFQHLPFKAVSPLIAPCQVNYCLNFDLTTQ